MKQNYYSALELAKVARARQARRGNSDLVTTGGSIAGCSRAQLALHESGGCLCTRVRGAKQVLLACVFIEDFDGGLTQLSLRAHFQRLWRRRSDGYQPDMGLAPVLLKFNIYLKKALLDFVPFTATSGQTVFVIERDCKLANTWAFGTAFVTALIERARKVSP